MLIVISIAITSTAISHSPSFHRSVAEACLHVEAAVWLQGREADVLDELLVLDLVVLGLQGGAKLQAEAAPRSAVLRVVVVGAPAGGLATVLLLGQHHVVAHPGMRGLVVTGRCNIWCHLLGMKGTR